MNGQEEIDQEENEETSLREDMEAAMSEVEENDEQPSEGDNVEETPEVEKAEAQKPKNGDSTPGAAAEAEAGAADKPGTAEVKAPQSWSPKLREDFGKLPGNVQAQINKRETEISTFLNEGAESRKFGDRMTQSLQPYQSVMAAHGASDPVQAVQGLMETATMLQMGTPQQKAEKLAQMVQHYGVDISMLDGALSGQPMADPQQSQLEKMLEQKLAPMQQFMSTVQQTQQQSLQQVQQTAQTEVGTFEQNAEFIGDVRNDMADLLDMAAKRGQTMSLQQAYDKACAINPDINAVLQQRANDEKIKGTQRNNQHKRYAASSIRGSQGGSQIPAQPDSIMGALNQAWDDSNG